MGQSKSKARYTKYEIPTVITGQRGPHILWNYTTYDFIPSTSQKHPNRGAVRCTNRNNCEQKKTGVVVIIDAF